MNLIAMAALPEDVVRPKRAHRRQPDRMQGEHGVLLSPHVVAGMLGVTTETLRTWRYLGKRLHEHVKDVYGRVWYYSDVVKEYQTNNPLRYVDA